MAWNSPSPPTDESASYSRRRQLVDRAAPDFARRTSFLVVLGRCAAPSRFAGPSISGSFIRAHCEFRPPRDVRRLQQSGLHLGTRPDRRPAEIGVGPASEGSRLDPPARSTHGGEAKAFPVASGFRAKGHLCLSCAADWEGLGQSVQVGSSGGSDSKARSMALNRKRHVIGGSHVPSSRFLRRRRRRNIWAVL